MVRLICPRNQGRYTGSLDPCPGVGCPSPAVGHGCPTNPPEEHDQGSDDGHSNAGDADDFGVHALERVTISGCYGSLAFEKRAYSGALDRPETGRPRLQLPQIERRRRKKALYTHRLRSVSPLNCCVSPGNVSKGPPSSSSMGIAPPIATAS